MSSDADRLPPIHPDAWTPAQRAEAQEIINGPRGKLITPFIPLIRSPELMGHCQRMGEYLRYRSSIGLRLSELAILLTARFWNQSAEWAIHAPIALEQGIDPLTVDAILDGREPVDLPPDEALVFRFCQELHATKTVSDAVWEQSIQLLGEQGTIDLIGVNGYYAMLAMVMNAAHTPAPASPGPKLR